MIKHSRVVQWLATGLAIVLTLVAVLLLTWWQVQHDARQVLADVAGHQRRSVERILGQSVQNLQTIVPWAGRPCAGVGRELQAAGALQPYFRTIVLVSGGEMYCSSVTGEISLPLSEALQVPVGGDGARMQLVNGTPMVPERPALLMYLAAPGSQGGRDGVLGSIDAAYLLNMLNTIKGRDITWAAFSFRDGALVSGETSVQARLPASAHMSLTLASERFPFAVALSASPALLRRLTWVTLPVYLAFGAIIAMLLAVGVHSRLGPDRTARRQIAGGIRRGEFKVYYQPVIDLRSGLCTGAEALLRWHHPVYGLVRPDAFIPLAENSELIVDLTRLVLRQIRTDVSSGDLPAGTHIGVNLAQRHLRNRTIVADIVRIYGPLLATYPLVAEITERHLVRDVAMAHAVLTELQRAGVEVALDDFGTESNSIGYLRQFRFDYLKIDKEFLPVSPDDVVTRNILDSIIDLSARLELTVVAEGVENAAQRDYLRGRGVQYAQGYLYSRPIAFADLAAYISTVAQRRVAV